jgi:hypothetical protein
VLDKYLKQLLERQREIEQGMFDSPPVDWPATQYRLGGWAEVQRLIADIQQEMKGLEDEI